MVRNAFRLTAAALAVTAILEVAACNYTEGECYRREDIEGTGSDGAGGGTIVPGWGGYGDVPPEPQNTTEPEPVDCNATENQGGKQNDGSQDDDSSYEAGLKVFCVKADHGALCSERCLAKGVGCVPLALHPYKPDAGIGKLFACNTLILGFMCSYAYENGDSCRYVFGNPFPHTCSYTGKD